MRTVPSPWTRPRDRVVVGVIVLLVAAAGMLVWAGSDSRATSRSTARGGGEALDVPSAPPQQLAEAWRARSPATPEPVAGGSTVITGRDGTVAGRDALSGKQQWFYQRDLDLCTVGGAWSNVLAVYRKASGCSEVTKLNTATGRRLAQRNGDAELGTRLIGDGTHVLTTGRSLLNVWGQDLIRAMEYGQLPAPVEPNRQPRPGCSSSTTSSSGEQVETSTPESLSLRCLSSPGVQPRAGCTFASSALAAGKIAVVERCPGDRSEWLTVIGTTNTVEGDNKSDQPKVLLFAQLPGVDASVVAVARSGKPRAAVVLPRTRQLMIYGERGKLVNQFGLDLPSEDLRAEPPGRTPQLTRGASSFLWFTGSATLALDDQTLRPRWTLPDTKGSGVLWAGSTLMPIDGGLAVIDEKTGKPSRTIAVDRGGYAGPVELGYVGPVLLEQRGDTLVALR